jgi:phosphoribosylaminoimidazolecarboxamide formyltransferase/IMP cyclohydrolase
LISRALISVYEKRGLDNLAKTLHKFGVKLLSTEGTTEKLKELGYASTDITEYVGQPEAPDGLVKTLHPLIHGGVLLDPSSRRHKRFMMKHGVPKIDMVVVNFHPPPEKHDRKVSEIARQIDVGGPALARAAAKAALLYGSVAAVTDVDQYALVIDELERNKGKISGRTKRILAIKALEKTRSYDETIVSLLSQIP